MLLHCFKLCIFLSALFSFANTENKGIKYETLDPAPPLRAKLTTKQSWIEESVEKHNCLRSLHTSQPLILNNTLSEISQSYANYLLQRALEDLRPTRGGKIDFDNIYFDHNKAVLKKHRLGENLFFSTHNLKDVINSSYAIDLWYNEIKDYDFETGLVKSTSDPRSMIGHFTQLVWNSTNQMGTAYSTGKLPTGQLITFVVANYYPGGNINYAGNSPKKLYFKNVLPRNGTCGPSSFKVRIQGLFISMIFLFVAYYST